jgi:hypothetical protein
MGITIAAFTVVGPSAIAAKPGGNHWTESFSFDIHNFCRSGTTVNFSVTAHGTEYLTPTERYDYRQLAEGTVVFTNVLTGATVSKHFANQLTTKTISGDPAGLHTVEVIGKGLGELIKGEHGGMLTRDAGLIISHEVWNGDQFISSEIIVSHGPHPDLGTDYSIFCPILISVLGL